MKSWDTTYIVGAGPSAGSLDVAKLNPSHVVVGVNDAFFHKPCDVFFSLDHNYILKTAKKLASYDCPKHVCLMDRVYYKEQFKPFTRWKRVYTDKPILEPKKLASGGPWSGCSGLAAINLAAQMGAKRVILFGYDFHHRYTYFYSTEVMKRSHAREVMESFRKMAPWYRQHGIEVINANLDSYIDAFEHVSHDMVYEMVARGL